MKDAKGHGSNAHSSGIASLPRSIGFKVEKQITASARTAAGQRNTAIGSVWQRVASGKRRAVAERIAQLSRVDNPNSLIRIRS